MRLSPPTLLGLAGALNAVRAEAAYSLCNTYDQSNFFDSFDFFTSPDPTRGFVEYVDQKTARQAGLVGNGVANNSFIMAVDSQTVNPTNGRRSVRLTSKDSFTRGLFLADIVHMPSSTCGVWPAFWMFGPNWPSSGEIDIIEGVNTQSRVAITLHTSPGCTVTNQGSVASTRLKTADCGANGSSGGCSQQTGGAAANYGDGFNAGQGGVYATEWTSDHIAVWFFPRASLPPDVAAGQPDPSSWGMPLARFSGCDMDSHFFNNQLVFDTTFCGDWAGNPGVWAADVTCSAKAATCQDYVAANPGDFREAYWEVNSVKVFQQKSTQQPRPPYGSSPPQPPPQSTGTTYPGYRRAAHKPMRWRS
ncbi:hypothetical protein L249_8439 [Ophiocordyceps polyrhachis-furcata BCC 54312]|uniref:endo-1,3(4)-beta-glucanase n=1 Tax=Ophiocordyceps polyrhachis-furcata BCC 54312 TaxID=1330021 RepID=A0A367L699_9HYPO|nr:hypothetical protein L249_8439 [Ophiocordyceps polyrhachis-furcata BCC 54312]